MIHQRFHTFFAQRTRALLDAIIGLALEEDGPDLTSQAVFEAGDPATAVIVAKEEAVVCGLPLAPLVLEAVEQGSGAGVTFFAHDGDTVQPGHTVAEISASARAVLKAERVILNFITHLSGVASLTNEYAQQLKGTGTVLLDTRKTMPGMRHLDKYAVLVGGGQNHRADLAEMLMLKDNHIDRAGGITGAVDRLRRAYSPCPPIEVECRTPEEVREAASLGVDRIMLDNMAPEMLADVLAIIPKSIQTEVSGGVDLNTIGLMAQSGPDFISVGRLTHSARSRDFSMQIRIK